MGFAFTVEELARARSVRCPLCKKPAGADCISTIGREPLKRTVHFCRLELSR